MLYHVKISSIFLAFFPSIFQGCFQGCLKIIFRFPPRQKVVRPRNLFVLHKSRCYTLILRDFEKSSTTASYKMKSGPTQAPTHLEKRFPISSSTMQHLPPETSRLSIKEGPMHASKEILKNHSQLSPGG